MNYIEKEKLIKADIASIENRVRHAFNQGYDLGFKDGKKRAKALEQKPCMTMKELSDEELKHFAEEMKKARPQVIQQEPCEDVVERSKIDAAIKEIVDYADDLFNKTSLSDMSYSHVKHCLDILKKHIGEVEHG